ncbi:MAG TPA: type 1 glutamine amidotransferase, partial [Aestuariivirgaceae bacterium]|nr:type 1 glutamine amidotransferase [Aestuariivirgaceae bacterium]
MKPILIVQNDHHEGAGALATLIAERGLEQHSVLGSKADYTKLPSGAFGALVVLGGAQSAYETDKYPYLLVQMQLCRDFIAAGKPIAGFCLGAQILACAVGGEVVPGKRKEIGWYDLVLTEDGTNDPLMQEHPRKLLSYHFHGDVIANVPDATRLAFSDMTECQLFRYGEAAYGFQYHAEA